MQAQLDALARYCSTWGLTVSTCKTEHMQVFTGPTHLAPSATRVTYQGVPIKWTATFRYLGVIFSNDGSFTPFFRLSVDKARRAMFACLARVAKLSDRCPLSFRVTLLRAYVVSIAMYACDALVVPKWYVKQINSIMYTFLRWMLKLPGLPSTISLFRECGVVGIETLIARAQASFLATNRFFRSPPHYVLDAIHSIASEPRSTLHKGWFVPAAHYLVVAGLGGTVLPLEIRACKPRLWKPAVTEWLKRTSDLLWLRECTKPRWGPVRDNVYVCANGVNEADPFLHSALPAIGRKEALAEPASARAALQRALLGDGNTHWHPDLATLAVRSLAGYAHATLPPHQLRAVAFFRLGCAPLALHVQHDLPVTSRVCQFCHKRRGLRIVEDQFHVVFECPLYDCFRVSFLKTLLPLPDTPRENTPHNALAHILCTNDASHSRALGRFLSRVLHTREIFLLRSACLPIPSRPDTDVCTQAATTATIDPSMRTKSESHLVKWWSRPLPCPYVLTIPASGSIFM